jgi:hypothetical protein
MLLSWSYSRVHKFQSNHFQYHGTGTLPSHGSVSVHLWWLVNQSRENLPQSSSAECRITGRDSMYCQNLQRPNRNYSGPVFGRVLYSCIFGRVCELQSSVLEIFWTTLCSKMPWACFAMSMAFDGSTRFQSCRQVRTTKTGRRIGVAIFQPRG